MSPEGFDGKRSVQTDVWAAGVNLYQLLTGALPFPQKEPSALVAAIMMREFEPLPAGVSIPAVTIPAEETKVYVAPALTAAAGTGEYEIKAIASAGALGAELTLKLIVTRR